MDPFIIFIGIYIPCVFITSICIATWLHFKHEEIDGDDITAIVAVSIFWPVCLTAALIFFTGWGILKSINWISKIIANKLEHFFSSKIKIEKRTESQTREELQRRADFERQEELEELRGMMETIRKNPIAPQKVPEPEPLPGKKEIIRQGKKLEI